MSLDFSRFSVFSLAFLLGLRHGIDWDHLAAITDISGTSGYKKESLILALLYVVGHATVVVILGLIIILVGVNLPAWVDPLMEHLVGVTLLILGFWLMFSVFRHGPSFRLKSRWMLIFEAVNKLSFFLHNKIPHKHKQYKLGLNQGISSLKVAFIIGLVHGIGAETPTQILLFITAAGMNHSFFAIILLVIFVFGLIVSNTLISIFSVFGYAKVKENSGFYLVLGLTTAVFSLVVGSLFLFNKGNLLPAIIGD
ncbi:hypothetical protein A2954_06090 [Candidatus Roizmanbacteria bacterium RIFCSPLOWO2_01_FULL_37_12]|uniref:Nickel/cobalt efflux system n=1 Tax=Candidatus Roizmanbacteria bacterium RIFCSPLOWO2_01_FULL_37_12 TaxID=1802056 RepID=A0A1F7ICI6_9BACT|nr:MAG: hypothetical protein A2768_01250 [Candidatus Roizmanbacteria bacterium RIFCSPHIGHO2_01_FULL_37_16]OGK24386.1 MAG: hypothetical protein A3D76_01860 [Candidatus Roizmanbacteria bacterium RIFCSPHIGHO2_02_FULL_37_9b]OGK41074.1 MAG: hypothetical protein A2954_06090 [Candidatus Roizmanbacteria bacterium RIFCSPLOWO2_01_FULL_37_12]